MLLPPGMNYHKSPSVFFDKEALHYYPLCAEHSMSPRDAVDFASTLILFAHTSHSLKRL